MSKKIKFEYKSFQVKGRSEIQELQLLNCLEILPEGIEAGKTEGVMRNILIFCFFAVDGSKVCLDGSEGRV